MRILLALGTGLRRGDIGTWRVSDLDFEKSYVTTRSIKTRKSMSRQAKPGVSGHMEPYHEERYN
jgi:integrase